MSHEGDISSGEEHPTFYEGLEPDWTEIETPAFHAAFVDFNAYCTEPLVPPSILTPVSLPDSSFRPSPALGHHSPEFPQEYDYEYGYNINSSIAPQGLGITAQFPSDFPQTLPPSSGYVYAPDDLQFHMGGTPSTSPPAPPPKKVRRISRSHTPSRDTPINILPHPEGVERIERERQNPRPPPLPNPRPRGVGRGRRDPQTEEEDAFVEELRQRNTAWKIVRQQFVKRFNKEATEARLQMRLLRRRKERLTRWEDQDLHLLMNANEMWENERYNFIADKMKELGATKEYTPEQCRTQLRVIEARNQRQNMGSASPTAMSDPAHSPAPSMSRKRGRSPSLEPE